MQGIAAGLTFFAYTGLFVHVNPVQRICWSSSPVYDETFNTGQFIFYLGVATKNHKHTM
jgi:hypothetical protein